MKMDIDFARRLADAAASQTLPRFRQEGLVDNKLSAGFDPVTEADREAELAIRALLRETFPDHGIVGEEFGVENEDARHIWIIDPIDGTRAFISGMPLWGTLIGLTEGGDAIEGVMSQPFIGELFWTEGGQSRYQGPRGERLLATRKTTSLADATLGTTSPSLFADQKRSSYDKLESAVRLARYGTDCYAYAMLAAGHLDLVVESGLQPYDIVALIPIIEQAGGVVTTWDGGAPEQGGDIVAAATRELHEAAMARLAEQP